MTLNFEARSKWAPSHRTVRNDDNDKGKTVLQLQIPFAVFSAKVVGHRCIWRLTVRPSLGRRRTHAEFTFFNLFAITEIGWSFSQRLCARADLIFPSSQLISTSKKSLEYMIAAGGRSSLPISGWLVHQEPSESGIRSEFNKCNLSHWMAIS